MSGLVFNRLNLDYQGTLVDREDLEILIARTLIYSSGRLRLDEINYLLAEAGYNVKTLSEKINDGRINLAALDKCQELVIRILCARDLLESNVNIDVLCAAMDEQAQPSFGFSYRNGIWIRK